MTQKRNAALTQHAGRAERAARLYRLLQFIGRRPQTRKALTRYLRHDVRSFYRDLDLLRTCGIDLPLRGGRYCLSETILLPLPGFPFPTRF